MELDDVVPWGRSRREYEAMFRLDEQDLAGRILGCADGPASFNAELSREGHAAISVDPLYALDGAEIGRRFEASVERVMAQVEATPHDWTWTFHKSSAALLRTRRRVIETFLADYDAGRREGRYRVASLPQLPFEDGAFDLALCSHFLFLYSDHFSEEFHVSSALELCRVASEVRIFPLLSLSRGFSRHVDPVREALRRRGVLSEVVTVDYELQKGGNEMLRLVRADS